MHFKESEQNKTPLVKPRMTATRLKSFKGFENYSEEQATSTIKILEEFAQLLCTHIQNTN